MGHRGANTWIVEQLTEATVTCLCFWEEQVTVADVRRCISFMPDIVI